MPLTAIIRDQRIIGPDLSPEAWNDLKKEHKKGLPVIMCCCGARGHLRKSKKGLQHFYHVPGSEPCNWEHESLAHLEIKNEIYQICKNAVWETYVEYTSLDGDWRADVYAQKGDKKIVFEVQLTIIPKEVLKERDGKYKEKGIEAYWLLKNRSKYQLNDFQHFDEDLDYIPYIDCYYSSEPGCENPNIFEYYLPQDVLAVEIDLHTRLLSIGNNEQKTLIDWIHSILDGTHQQNLKKIREEFEFHRELRKIAKPILEEVHESHMRIIKISHDLKQQYAIFMKHSLNKSYQIRENIRLIYSTKKEMNKFFYGRILSPKLGWKWIQSEDSSHIEHVLHLKSYEHIYEIQKLSRESLQQIDLYEKLLGGLIQQIQGNSISEKPIEPKKEIPLPSLATEFTRIRNKRLSDTEIESSDIKDNHNPPKKWKTKFFSSKTNEEYSGLPSQSGPRVKFLANNNLTGHFLVSSDGTKYQVIPGLPVEMSKPIATEFEKQGYGRIIE